MQDDTQRNHKGSSQDETPLWMRQVMDAFDAGEKQYGKLANVPRKHQGLKISIKNKLKKLDQIVGEKGDELLPKGEWGKFISRLIKEYVGDYTSQYSAILAFTAGYTWQKDRKNWVSRNNDNLQHSYDQVIKLSKELGRKIAYHWYCYNVLDRPEISDNDYDAMVKETQNLENRHPELKQQATKAHCITRWLYEAEKLLEANISDKGELAPTKTAKKRGGKLNPDLLHKFIDAIPDEPVEVVPDEEWQTVFCTFFERLFKEHTVLITCRTAFVAGAAWHKYRGLLDQ